MADGSEGRAEGREEEGKEREELALEGGVESRGNDLQYLETVHHRLGRRD